MNVQMNFHKGNIPMYLINRIFLASQYTWSLLSVTKVNHYPDLQYIEFWQPFHIWFYKGS